MSGDKDYADIRWYCCGWASQITDLAENHSCLKVKFSCQVCGAKVTRYYDMADGRFLRPVTRRGDEGSPGS